MSNRKSSLFRHVLLAAGIAVLVFSFVLLFRHRLAEGFFCAFLGLSGISASETDIDHGARLDARSFATLMRGRSSISTLGKLCDITSYFCLAAALISWLALR
jgi:hypothetical protein